LSLPETLTVLDGRPGFPPLPGIAIALHRPPGRASLAVDLAADHIAQSLGLSLP